MTQQTFTAQDFRLEAVYAAAENVDRATRGLPPTDLAAKLRYAASLRERLDGLEALRDEFALMADDGITLSGCGKCDPADYNKPDAEHTDGCLRVLATKVLAALLDPAPVLAAGKEE